MAAGRALPPGRLAWGEAAEMRIGAAAFPRAAHMCQVKCGFGSWQHRPERGTRTSGQVLGSLPLTPAPALQGPGMRLLPGKRSPAGDPGAAGFPKGDEDTFEHFLGQKAIQQGYLQTPGGSRQCPLQKGGIRERPGGR